MENERKDEGDGNENIFGLLPLSFSLPFRPAHP